jgi:TonB family protein
MLSAVVNHLWQSTLVLAAVASLVALLRDQAARVRYWLWWAASVKFLVPFSLLAWLGSALGGVAPPVFELTDWPTTLDRLAEPMREASAGAPVLLLGLWALGFAAVVAWWAVRALRVRALVRASVPHAASLPRGAGGPEARTAPALVEPALVGIFRPVLLLPQGIASHLTPAQLDAVLAHELAHWRRRDNLTAAAHMLVEAVFWFHPLVWWLGARLVDERERACDEAVVRAGHDGRTYAEGILNVCEHYVASALKCAAGVSGADLKRRVVEIARNRLASDLPMAKKILLGTFALATVLVPILLGTVSGRAAAQDDRSLIPLVRIAPTYPPEALAAGLDGAVTLEFTIATDGTTTDVVVVDSTAPEFEAAAMTALLRWRYTPPPVERQGVRTVIRFQLQR